MKKIILLVFLVFMLTFMSVSAVAEGGSCGYMPGAEPRCDSGLACNYFQCVETGNPTCESMGGEYCYLQVCVDGRYENSEEGGWCCIDGYCGVDEPDCGRSGLCTNDDDCCGGYECSLFTCSYIDPTNPMAQEGSNLADFYQSFDNALDEYLPSGGSGGTTSDGSHYETGQSTCEEAGYQEGANWWCDGNTVVYQFCSAGVLTTDGAGYKRMDCSEDELCTITEFSAQCGEMELGADSVADGGNGNFVLPADVADCKAGIITDDQFCSIYGYEVGENVWCFLDETTVDPTIMQGLGNFMTVGSWSLPETMGQVAITTCGSCMVETTEGVCDGSCVVDQENGLGHCPGFLEGTSLSSIFWDFFGIEEDDWIGKGMVALVLLLVLTMTGVLAYFGLRLF
jgi:hypothetical protein